MGESQALDSLFFGRMAERLGVGLQIQLQGFESLSVLNITSKANEKQQAPCLSDYVSLFDNWRAYNQLNPNQFIPMTAQTKKQPKFYPNPYRSYEPEIYTHYTNQKNEYFKLNLRRKEKIEFGMIHLFAIEKRFIVCTPMNRFQVNTKGRKGKEDVTEYLSVMHNNKSGQIPTTEETKIFLVTNIEQI